MATKTKARKSSSNKHKSFEHIKHYWGDVEVVDAKKDLRVFIQPEDVRSATAKDPGCCVFAQACKRQFAATKVLFWRSVAYVELPGPDGKRRVERFSLSPDMRELIENFDRGNRVAEVAGFELKKPRPSESFEGKAERMKRYSTERKEALLSGASVRPKKGKQGEGAYSKPAVVVDLEVRNGSGRVHFRNDPEAV
jgi:hypothetical protein